MASQPPVMAMTMTAVPPSSIDEPRPAVAGPGPPIVTESSRPNAARRTWPGEKAAGDGEMTGRRPPMLPRGLGQAGPGSRAAGSAGT